MEHLKHELERWLCEQFPHADVLLQFSPLAQNVGGYLVWEGFVNKEPSDRQHLLSMAIRARFSRDDQRFISLIVTLTPNEYAVMREPQMA